MESRQHASPHGHNVVTTTEVGCLSDAVQTHVFHQWGYSRVLVEVSSAPIELLKTITSIIPDFQLEIQGFGPRFP